MEHYSEFYSSVIQLKLQILYYQGFPGLALPMIPGKTAVSAPSIFTHQYSPGNIHPIRVNLPNKRHS